LPSAPLDVAEDLPNGHSQVEDEKADIHDSPKTAVPILSGWAQAVMKGRVQNVETVPTGKFCVGSTTFSCISFCALLITTIATGDTVHVHIHLCVVVSGNPS
jgi:hypothetical protein